VTAVVRGSVEYDVVLDGQGDGCTCPVGLRGTLCKHLIATVLTLEDDGARVPAGDTADETPVSSDELADLVESLRVRGHPDDWQANALGEHTSDDVYRPSAAAPGLGASVNDSGLSYAPQAAK
jgi:uncharacterized Zn finger protein